MSWVLCGTKDDTAPLSVINSLRKNDIAFFDVVRLVSDGETNTLDGVNSTERAALLRKLIARTGQRTRLGRSPTKSARDWTMTDLGRGFDTDSVLPEKTGHNGEPDRLPYETQNERACSSPIRLAVAIAKRNSAFLVLFQKEASAKGSKKGGLTSTPKTCPNPMEANDVMGEELRSQRSAPGP